jgi:hypothetical protein
LGAAADTAGRPPPPWAHQQAQARQTQQQQHNYADKPPVGAVGVGSSLAGGGAPGKGVRMYGGGRFRPPPPR